MLPWEHLAFGYVLYSAYCHLYHRRPPTGAEVVALALGTQLPDLIDKPLAWLFQVLPSGHALGHSFLFVVPVVIAVRLLAGAAGRADVGWGFGAGLLSHPPADVISPLLFGRQTYLGFLVWPYGDWPFALQTLDAIQADLVTKFVLFFLTPAGQRYLAVELVALLAVYLLWRYDGQPGRTEVGAVLPMR